MQVERLVGVYDADGGVAGELRYAMAKLLGRAHCALCDITHGTVRAKPAWHELEGRLGVPVELVHRNERSTDVAEVTGEALPAVLADTGDELVVLLVPDELEPAAGDVVAFERLLRGALDARALTLPGQPGQPR